MFQKNEDKTNILKKNTAYSMLNALDKLYFDLPNIENIFYDTNLPNR